MVEKVQSETNTEFTVEGCRVIVVGAARSGLAAAELLAARGADVVVTDICTTVNQDLGRWSKRVTFELGEHRNAAGRGRFCNVPGRLNAERPPSAS